MPGAPDSLVAGVLGAPTERVCGAVCTPREPPLYACNVDTNIPTHPRFDYQPSGVDGTQLNVLSFS